LTGELLSVAISTALAICSVLFLVDVALRLRGWLGAVLGLIRRSVTIFLAFAAAAAGDGDGDDDKGFALADAVSLFMAGGLAALRLVLLRLLRKDELLRELASLSELV